MHSSLKGKGKKGLLAIPSDGMEHHETTGPTPIKDIWFHFDDVESAVKGLKKDLKKSTPWGDVGIELCELVDKWFADVIE